MRLLHPQTLLIVAGLLMLAFSLVPPDFYSYYVQEPDLMFGNVLMYGLIFAGLLLVWLGMQLGVRLPRLRRWPMRTLLVVQPLALILPPLLAAWSLLLLTMGLILHSDPAILGLAMAGQGQQIKLALHLVGQGSLTGSLPLAMGVSWWTLDRMLVLGDRIGRWQHRTIWALVSMLIVTLVASGLLLVARFVLMPTLFGLFLVYLRHRVLVRGASIGGLMLRAGVAALGILLLFGAMAMLRTSGSTDAVITSFLAYGPSSVNHLAALVDGRLNVDFISDRLLWNNFAFIFEFPFASRLFDWGSQMRGPFQESFWAIQRAGLNNDYNWFTALGEIFGGLGLLAVPYLLVLGLFLGRVWRQFERGSMVGVLLYPWLGFGVLFSFGSNFVASQFLSVLMVLALLLHVYTRIVGVRGKVPSSR
jgi:hypothetical protein